MTHEDKSDALGLIGWNDLEGVIVPSGEGYGVILTADPSRIVITVPLDVADTIDKNTPEAEAKRKLQPMLDRIVKMLDRFELESKGPE